MFLDANIFIYHFAGDLTFGLACNRVIRRIEQQDLIGFTSTHVLSNVAHRLMTLEAMAKHGWPLAAIGRRLRTNPSAVAALTNFRHAIDRVSNSNLSVLVVGSQLVSTAAAISQ